MELQECFERITNEIDNFIDNGECPTSNCCDCPSFSKCQATLELRKILVN